MVIDVEKNYALFKKYLSAYVKRDGTDKFLRWLDTTDFKTAPVSTKYHLCQSGGLCQHSLNVFLRLIRLMRLEYEDKCPYSKDTIALVSLLHDVSKVGRYKPYFKNVKNEETGEWVKEPCYTVYDDAEKFVFGSHQEDSIYIIRQFFTLTMEEEMAILHHHGGFDADDTSRKATVGLAFERSALAILMHTADSLATFIDEATKSNDWRYPFDLPDESSETVSESPVASEPVNQQSTPEQSTDKPEVVENESKSYTDVPTPAIDDCPF